MRRILVLAAAAALALAAAPAAVAKEVTKAEVCGPDGCVSANDQQTRMTLIQGGAPTQPPIAAPYYEVRITMAAGDETHTWGFAAVPDRQVARADDGTWMRMPDETTGIVKQLTLGQKPYPASALIGAVAPHAPKPVAADADSLLWPEGVVIALIAIAAAFLVRGMRLRGVARRA
jgi:hypothetical protein